MSSLDQFLERELTLPDGGGIIQGFDPVIRQDGFTGAAALTVPLVSTPARGVSLDLALTYHSSVGNTEFGLGFTLDVPAVTRMTDQGVPRYAAADRYTMTGVGPLTPKLDPATSRPGQRCETDADGAEWSVVTFLPCQQVSLPLVEQWTDTSTGASHWRVTSSRGAVSLFGATGRGRVADPADPSRVFQWLVEETVDAHGNRTVFEYKAENSDSVREEIYEQGRVVTARRYVERIKYGSYYPETRPAQPGPPVPQRRAAPAAAAPSFAFEVVFDYGEYELDISKPDSDPYTPVRPWPERADPFSTYIAGFEIRTFRLCRGVLMFHHFPSELGPQPCLVHATRFGYHEDPGGSLLTSVTPAGYRRRGDGSYLPARSAPLRLAYSRFDPPAVPAFRKLGVQGAPAAPGYLVKGSYLPVDLDGDGLPGFLLSLQDAAWYYPPEGDGRYAGAAPLPAVPDSGSLADPRLSVEDLDGDGGLQLMVLAPAATGYFARTKGTWSPFTALPGSPTSYAAPRAELADLDGDGRSELFFVTRDEVIYYPSLGTAGFAPARAAPRQPGFPSGTDTSATELISFAGAFGDALAHRVRVSDGEVAIWPNLGHGRFAPRVRMAGAPRLPRDLTSGRIYLADLDRTGTADLVFAFPDRLLVYRNQSGNSFAPPLTVPLPFQLTSHDQITFADVLGSGTTAIVLSRMAPVVEHWYCDLCQSTDPAGSATRPNLLTQADNGLGAVSEAQYGSSTGFLLADKRSGRPWLGRMPTAVPVVIETVAHDLAGQASTTTSYRYHDGYFDAYFRQFQGFGLVETVETQSITPPAAATETPIVPAPPARTRTWYHTGAYTEAAALRARRHAEYFHGDPAAYQLPDSLLEPAVLAAGGDTARQAYRALAGRTLRIEVYGEDSSARSALPYTVTDLNYTVRLVQAAAPAVPGSFYITPRERVDYRYDREPADPRIEHSMLLVSTLADPGGADTYTERTAAVTYPRRPPAAAGRDRVPEQQTLQVVVDDARYTRVTAGFRMAGMPVETRSLDIGGLAVPPGGYFSFAELSAAVGSALAAEIPYGVPFTPGKRQSRPASWGRVYYWDAQQAGPLPLGRISPAGLCHHTEQAAFSDAWLAEVFGGRVAEGELAAAGYLHGADGYWWNPGDVTSFYGPGEPGRFRLPFQRESYALHNGMVGPYALVTAGYDTPYCLVQSSRAGHADAQTPVPVTGSVDYQAAELWQLTDGNGVVRQALFDPLGAVLATSLFKPATGAQPRTGDMDLRDYQVRDATFASVLADHERYLQGAAAFYFYDRLAWVERRSPAGAVGVTATRYQSDPAGGPRPAETVIGYGDGLGQLAGQTRAAEPAGGPGDRSWIVSGRTVYTESGQPALQWLPYYAATPDFGPPPAAPPPSVLRYDPLGRCIRTDQPKGFHTATVYTPWQQRDYDENDTVLDSSYYQQFMASYPPDPTPAQRAEKDALDQAARCYGTPDVAVLDPAGNPVREIRDSLGDIRPDAFAAIVQGSGISSRELWDELHAQGYLFTDPRPAPHTGVTARFEPYTPGFALHLDPPFGQFAAAATDLLSQACLTSLAGFDQQGRVTLAIDPRLYYRDVTTGSAYTSAQYSYPMGLREPARTGSADSGQQLILTDVLGQVASAWDGRGLRQDRVFDGLRRPLTMVARAADGTSRTLEIITYGEHQAGAAQANLIGQAYQVKDETGVLLTPEYTISGLPSSAVRQYPQDYTTEPDWAGEVPLDPERYLTALRYDALGRPVERTTPDGATLTAGYHVSGRLAWLRGQAAGSAAVYLADAAYNAAGQRRRSSYGNGAEQASVYDDATLRLTSVVTQAPGAGPVQQVAYTYDPAGNVTHARDATARLVFGSPQPEATGDYRYDAIYRLLHASGIQHPGIDATTYATGFKQTLFAGLAATDLGTVTLEPYQESYRYDGAGNLISLDHVAASVTFGRASPVADDSNRLADVGYDGAGNQLSVDLPGPVALTWDACGNLAATAAVPRPDGGTEQSWFSYDSSGQRSRKVIVAHDASGQLAETVDVRYLGVYQDRRVTVGPGPASVPAGATLRIEDGDRLVTVVDTAASGRQTRFQLGDLLGSVSVELDADGTVLSYEGFFPTGGSSVIAAADREQAAPKTLRYSGEEADDSTSLYHYRGRYLAPWQGRWLSADPAGISDGLNLYAFVAGNPLTLIDRTGHGGEDPNNPPPLPGTNTQTSPPVTPPTNPVQRLNRPAPIQLQLGWPNREQVSRFLQYTAMFTLYTVFNAPRLVFALAPAALLDRYLGSEQTRERNRANRAARREEVRLLVWHLLTGFGVDPEARLPWPVLRLIRPRTSPVLTRELGPLGVPLHYGIDYSLRQPETYAEYVGGYLGSFITVTLMFTVGRRYAIRNAGWLIRQLTKPIPWIGGLAGLIGRGEDKDRQWAAHERRRNELPGPYRSQAIVFENDVIGIPRTLAYRRYLMGATDNFKDYAAIGVIVGLVSAGAWALFWFKGDPWPFRSTSSKALIRSDPKRFALMIRTVPKLPMTRSSKLPAVVKPKVTDLVAVQPKATSPAVVKPKVTDLTVVQPKVTDLVVVKPKVTDLVVVQPKATGVVTFTPKSTVPMVADPVTRQLAPYLPKASALTKALSPKNLLPRSPGAVIAVGVITAMVSFKEQFKSTFFTAKPPRNSKIPK